MKKLLFIILLTGCSVPEKPETQRSVEIQEYFSVESDRMIEILACKHEMGVPLSREIYMRYMWANYTVEYNLLTGDTVEIELYPKETAMETIEYFAEYFQVDHKSVASYIFDLELYKSKP